MGDLIPGLPDDLATECLIRLHFESFPNAVLTCKKWKHEIGSPKYLHRRKVGGHSQSISVMTQEGSNSDVEDSHEDSETNRLGICELKSGNWSELPWIPGYFKSFPFGCRFAVVGLNLVVVGGRHPRSPDASNRVYIYSFVSNTWRRGADMLDARLFFFCASDSDRTVYVVGGFDDEKMTQTMSSLAYDMEKDEWVRLPDVDNELENGGLVKATFQSGKLHVFVCFLKEPEASMFNLFIQSYDPGRSTWSPVCKYLLDTCRIADTVFDGQVGNVYLCGGGEVAVLENGKYQKVADLPVELYRVYDLMRWNKHLVIIGFNMYDMLTRRRTNMVCLLDLESKEWSNLEAPSSYWGAVQFACTADI